MSFIQSAQTQARREQSPDSHPALSLCAAQCAAERRQTDKQALPAKSRLIQVLGTFLGLVIFLSACSGTPTVDYGAMPAATSQSQDVPAAAGPLETAAASVAMPIYWLGRSGDSVYLYREFHAPVTNEDPLVAAMRAMMTNQPLDPSYFSMWSKPSRLAASISNRNHITLDISADAFKQKVDAGIAERSIAQLVYTVTAAAAAAGLLDASANVNVSILVDGHSGYKAFKQIDLGTPLTRNTSFIAPVWITTPTYGETLTGKSLTVEGQASSPNAMLNWTVTAVDAREEKTKKTGTLALVKDPNDTEVFSLSMDLRPGKYVLTVYAVDPINSSSQIGATSKSFEIVGS